jgi:hypothetical protein
MLVAAVLLLSSGIVYGRQAVGLRVPAQSALPLATTLVVLAALTLAATWIATRRGRNGLGSGVLLLLAFATFVPPAYAALTLVNPVHAHDTAALPIDVSPWGARCLVVAGLAGVCTLATLAIALRGAAPAASGARGAALGAAAGLWAGLAVFIFCPASSFQHLLLGHVLPVAAFTIVGFIALPRMLRP